jgi:hypothetical protein
MKDQIDSIHLRLSINIWNCLESGYAPTQQNYEIVDDKESRNNMPKGNFSPIR